MRIYYSLYALVLYMIVATPTLVSQLLDEPAVTATLSLPGSTLRRGNGIAIADENTIVLTTYEGDLQIHQTNAIVSDGKGLVYSPRNVNRNATINCQSNPVLVETINGSKYAVFAIVDIQDSRNTSRVLAINIADASLRWNITLPGSIIGSPLVSYNKDTVFIIHNIYNEESQYEYGRISMISVTDEGEGNATLIGSLPEAAASAAEAPFGPGTISFAQQQQGGGARQNDVRNIVFFGERRGNGFSSRGNLYALVQAPVNSRNGAPESEFYQLVLLSGYPGSGITAPAVSRNLDVYLGTQASNIVGYTDGRGFSNLLDSSIVADDDTNAEVIQWDSTVAFPLWIIELAASSPDENAPIPTTPILSPDGLYLYTAAAGNELACIRTSQQGEAASIVWSFETDWMHYATPVYQEVEGSTNVVYFIESFTGTIRQFNAEDGTLNWESTLGVEVEADFTISGNGAFIYLSDIEGDLRAVNIAQFESLAPTGAPTMNGTSATTTATTLLQTDTLSVRLTTSRPSHSPLASPTAIPTLEPYSTSPSTSPSVRGGAGTVSDPDSESEVEIESSSPANDRDWAKLSMYLGATCAGMALLTLITFLLLRREKNRKKMSSVSKDSVVKGEQRGKSNTSSLFELEEKNLEQEMLNEELETLHALSSTTNREQKVFDSNYVQGIIQDLDKSPVNGSANGTEGDGIAVNGFEINPDDNSISESYNDAMSDPYAVRSVHDTPTRLASTIPKEVKRLDEPIDHGSLSPPVSPRQMKQRQEDQTSQFRNATPFVPKFLADPSSCAEIPPPRPGTPSDSFIDSSLYSSPVPIDSPVQQLLHPIESSLSAPSEDEMDAYSNIMNDAIANVGGKENGYMNQQSIHRMNSANIPRQPALMHSTPPTVPSARFRLPGEASPHPRALSPTPSVAFSLDESLYVDESTITEADISAGNAIVDDTVFETKENKGCERSDDEDDPPAILKPGAHYLERHSKKFVDTEQPTRDDVLISQIDPNKLKPTYKGVSVRPSRSKAGIFSRRMPPLRQQISDDDNSTVIPEIDSQSSYNSPPSKESAIPRVAPIPASYYVEEHEPRMNAYSRKDQTSSQRMYYQPHKQKHQDSNKREHQKQLQQQQQQQFTGPGEQPKSAWSSLLQELSIVENEFFNPGHPTMSSSGLTNLQSHDEAESQVTQSQRPDTISTRRSNDDDGYNTGIRGNRSDGSGDSSPERAELPPPPPRTFYA